MYDIRLLHAEQSTSDWVDRSEYKKYILQKKPLKKNLQKKFEKTNSGISHDLLMKVQTNSKIMEVSEDFKTNSDAMNSIIEGNLSFRDNVSNSSQNDIVLGPTTIYNHIVDAFSMVENCKGFLDTNAINTHKRVANEQLRKHRQIFGIYGIRWRRAGGTLENESKFIINSIEIIEAPLNIYCYLDEKMYVKVPMTLRITLKNTANSTLYLKSILKNADNFMFAGHSQVCFFTQGVNRHISEQYLDNEQAHTKQNLRYKIS